MIQISKNREPQEWTRYKSTPGVVYSSIPELVKSLYQEQGYICAYCMRRIPCKDRIGCELTKEDHRVEHISWVAVRLYEYGCMLSWSYWRPGAL